MTYTIERNSVQETLVIPLYARKKCTELYPSLFSDEDAVRIVNEVDYDFSGLEAKAEGAMYRFGLLEVAMRQNGLAWEVRDYLASHPGAAVVNLGCGLDTTGRRCDNGTCRIINVDMPDVIAVRDELLPAGDREENVACDLNDTSWFDRIPANDGAVFFASGVFYYFTSEQVEALFRAMAGRFPGCRLVFDAAGKRAVRMMLKTWVKASDIDVDAYFSVSDPEADIGPWVHGAEVSARGMMRGYGGLDGQDIGALNRLLSWMTDGPMKVRIVRIDFRSVVALVDAAADGADVGLRGELECEEPQPADPHGQGAVDVDDAGGLHRVRRDLRVRYDGDGLLLPGDALDVDGDQALAGEDHAVPPRLVGLQDVLAGGDDSSDQVLELVVVGGFELRVLLVLEIDAHGHVTARRGYQRWSGTFDETRGKLTFPGGQACRFTASLA